jgi:hypothetical protein
MARKKPKVKPHLEASSPHEDHVTAHVQQHEVDGGNARQRPHRAQRRKAFSGGGAAPPGSRTPGGPSLADVSHHKHGDYHLPAHTAWGRSE